MSTETAGSGRPGEAEAIEAAARVSTVTRETINATMIQRFKTCDELATEMVAAAYPHIARATAAAVLARWRSR